MPYEKSTASSPEAQSASPIQDNLRALSSLFPSVVRDGQVDVDALRQLCGEAVVKEDELFGLNWRGKAEARRAALSPSLGTLRPSKEESKDWDTTQNLYIEGDNLEVLKLLRKSYGGRVKMIYIDPPYNTGKEFVYPDDYQNGIENYKKLTGQEGKFAANVESSGRFHTTWLNMMYPRLMLARDLLSEDGLIFVSIDDHEIENLKIILNNIFNERQFVGCFLWNKTSKAPTLSGKIRNKYEYILCYSKAHTVELKGKDSYNTHGPLFNSGNNHTIRTIQAKKLKCNFPDGIYPAGEYGINDKKVILHTDLIVTDSYNAQPVTIEGRFKWAQPTIDEYCARGFEFMYKTPSMITMYYDLAWDGQSFIAPSDIINKTECNVETNDEAHDALASLFDGLEVFDHPKPVSLLSYLIGMVNCKSGIYLDFFSGSSSFAHAVMFSNALDGGNRRCLSVQLPEPLQDPTKDTSPSAKVSKNAFSFLIKHNLPINLCEIGKERIRRAGEKVKEEAGLAGQNLDIGFRVYKLDSSNVKAWNPQAEDLVGAMSKYAEHLVGGRTEDDFLTEIMLKSGIDLVEEVQEREIAGHRVQSLGYGQYYACMAADLADDTEAVALGIAAWHEEDCAHAGGEQKDTCTVFVADCAFASNDAVKMNFVAILEQHGICNIKAL